MVKINVSHFNLERGPSSIPSGFAVETSMTCSRRDLPCSLIRMELDFCCLPEVVFHASVSCGQDPGVLKLDTVTQIYAVLGHS